MYLFNSINKTTNILKTNLYIVFFCFGFCFSFFLFIVRLSFIVYVLRVCVCVCVRIIALSCLVNTNTIHGFTCLHVASVIIIIHYL